MRSDDPLRTPEEAAERLRLKQQTLAVWRMTGQNLPFIRVGRSIRYRQSALDEYLQRRTIPAS